MKTYGTIGFPLTHSFSRQYFTEKIEREGIPDSVYYSFPLTTIEEFPAFLKNTPSLQGLAVTIPYKEKVLTYVTRLSEEVKQIGAANCIKVRGNELTAYNTDIIGFEKSFVKNLKPGNQKALVLGTGGASKAVQYVLKKLGIDFFIVSRNENEGQQYIQYRQISANIINDCKIIINATPLGMSPEENTCPDLPYHLLTPDHYLFDLVYKPPKTLFLQKGEQQGATIKNGFEMLIIQAEENWTRWNTD
ncbi:MAG: shikimate dehydrogenase [Chitinophagaceae bacterium]|nr:shikimate dehydrogenase [Chitinophagaceae bacterium]MBK9485452.1 shikimate dehydrogenase [Chitinophagaceae bacterium]